MIKKSLGVVLLALTGVVLGDTTAFAADYTQLCVAAATGDAGRVFIGSASTTPLAATGTGFDVGAWVFAGIAILIVGLAFTLLPSRRAVAAAEATEGGCPAESAADE